MTYYKKKKKRTVLVIGPGYLGTELIPLLISDYRVIALGRSPYPHAQTGVTLYRADAGNRKVLESCIKRSDIVINLLGGGGNQEVMAHPDWAIETYVLASQEICRLAKKYRVKHLLLASSVAAHGPRAPYGFLKLMQERILAASSVPHTILRFPNIFGVNAAYSASEKGLLGHFISSAVAGHILKIHGDGKQRIDYLHLSDATAAIKLLLSRPPKNNIYDAGTTQPKTVNYIARRIITQTTGLTGKRATCVHVPAPAETGYTITSSRALRALGWRPKISFNAGLKELIQNYVQEN